MDADCVMRGERVARSLVIVESPAKAKTIGKFLGRSYQVKASMGHIKDLPRSQFGVDVVHDFAPKYITIRGKGPILKELREAAKKVNKVLLATDPDREGEAISWHLAQALGLDGNEPCRVEFHEITKKTVQEAVKHARPIDQNLVNAQQARRILDRIVGYQLSPLLWSKVKPGLSAGRVQSVAVRLICDRAREIEAFEPEEYWTIGVSLVPEDGKGEFTAEVNKKDGKKFKLQSKEEADAVVADLKKASYVVSEVKPRERQRHPAAPFTTSTLQQEASRKLGFSARKTMRLAQQLYEGLDVGDEGTVGLITYIRTDAVRISEEAQAQAREYIAENYGKEYCPERPREYKSRQSAQGAHEAIRPTAVARTPEKVKPFLQRDQYRLYRLIWERFVASQMASAIMDTLTVDIAALLPGNAPVYNLRATGSKIKFPGFMILYVEQQEQQTNESEEKILPDLAINQPLLLRGIAPEQHFTQPPPQYTEAMLVKTLEELGIGRPSTYATIIDTIQRRGYVRLVNKRFEPTELGFVVTDLLKEHFAQILDTEFTAQMEAELDNIAEGQSDWIKVLAAFYGPFSTQLEQAQAEMQRVEIQDEISDVKCDQCGRYMVIKQGRFGKFLACPGFPECRNTKPLLQEIGVRCPKCGGAIVERRSKKGRLFYGCSRYPECDFVSWDPPVGRICPECGGVLVRKTRKSSTQIVCQNKECSYREAVEEV